jgi:hypothetical protein
LSFSIINSEQIKLNEYEPLKQASDLAARRNGRIFDQLQHTATE